MVSCFTFSKKWCIISVYESQNKTLKGIIIMETKILVETSARHVHLTKEHIEILFGAGHELTNKKDLSQPGQFACEERVTLVGARSRVEGHIILTANPLSAQAASERISEGAKAMTA